MFAPTISISNSAAVTLAQLLRCFEGYMGFFTEDLDDVIEIRFGGFNKHPDVTRYTN